MKSPQATIPQRLYAFWKYDSFPYVLGGTVEQMNKDGLVQTTEFGKGYWFKPIKLLPLDAGVTVQKALNDLREGHCKATKKLHQEWIAKLRNLFPEPKVGSDWT